MLLYIIVPNIIKENIAKGFLNESTFKWVGKFENNGINYNNVGFHLDDVFILAEQKGIITLEDYAEFIKLQSYSDQYIEFANEKSEKLASYIANLVIDENGYGQCVEVSINLTNLLDKLGIWNFCVKGSLTISSEDGKFEPQHFYDLTPNNEVAVPHAWIHIPGVGILDLTLQKQLYTSSEICNYLPKYNIIKEKDFSFIITDINDVVDPVIQINPNYKHHGEYKFEAVKMVSNNVTFRYITIAIGLPDAGFDENREIRKINDKTLRTIYEEVKVLWNCSAKGAFPE